METAGAGEWSREAPAVVISWAARGPPSRAGRDGEWRKEERGEERDEKEGKGEEKLRGERRWVGSKGREKRKEGRGGRRLGEGKGRRWWGRGCRRPEEEHRGSWGFMILVWTVGGPDAMGDEQHTRQVEQPS